MTSRGWKKMSATGTNRWVTKWPVLALALLALSCGRRKTPEAEPRDADQVVASSSQALLSIQWPAAAVTATNSVYLQTNAKVHGDVAVTQASPGQVLSSN